MAEIKMDVSEYETMKENKKLLEDALKKQEELQEQINLLNKEKIKALEDVKMKVVKIIRKEVYHRKVALRTPEDIIERFKHLLTSIHYGSPRHGSPRHSGYDYSRLHHDIYDMSKIFFQDRELEIMPNDNMNTITLHGLDEIKTELKKELEDDLNNDVKSKLEAYNTLSKDYKKLTEENKLLKKDLKFKLKAAEEFERLQKLNELYKEKNELYIELIVEIVKVTCLDFSITKPRISVIRGLLIKTTEKVEKIEKRIEEILIK